MVDPANLLEIWYGGQCAESSYVGLISLDETGAPVAVRPSVPTRKVLLDRTRGRAIFGGFDRLVLVHYADPSAAASDEVVDLSAVVAPFTAPGASCSGTNPCSGTDLCAGATDTAYTGQCTPNPRLPYRGFCGGFGQDSCDDDFDCKLVNPTNPNSVGECIGYVSRDYASAGPACTAGLPCPTGMVCGDGDRCEPKSCVGDADCAAYPDEICGLVANLGRVCLAPGPLADGSACLGADECLHGACVAIRGAAALGDGAVLHGLRGLLACTSPCHENADCQGGAQCISERPRALDEMYGSPTLIWQIHRAQVMPYCQPALLAPLAGCEECTSAELCAVGNTPQPGCQLGFDPWVFVKDGAGTAQYCLPPTESCQVSGFCPDGGDFDFRCKFPCQRSGDCLFGADCVSGSCSVGPLCSLACGVDESCAWFDPGTSGFCAISDSCRSDADCGGDAGSCFLSACIGPSRVCNTGSDCEVGEECVERWWDGFGRHCLPAQCDCAGPSAGDMVCDFVTDTCFTP